MTHLILIGWWGWEMDMRIDPVQLQASAVHAETDRIANAGAARPRPADSVHLRQKNPSVAPSPRPKYDVTVEFDNQVLVTKFIDSESGKLVQQIPSEELMKIINNIQELLQESSQRVLDIFR